MHIIGDYFLIYTFSLYFNAYVEIKMAFYLKPEYTHVVNDYKSTKNVFYIR